MAIPPEVVQINPDDVAKDEKKVVEYLAGILNNFLLESTNSLNKQLTFGDNFRGEVRSLTVVGGEDITFKYNGSGVPRGLILSSYRNLTNESEVLTNPVGIPQWIYDGRNSITVRAIPNLTVGNNYLITFIILGE